MAGMVGPDRNQFLNRSLVGFHLINPRVTSLKLLIQIPAVENHYKNKISTGIPMQIQKTKVRDLGPPLSNLTKV